MSAIDGFCDVRGEPGDLTKIAAEPGVKNQRGVSPRNLTHVRSFAASWPELSIVQQLAAQIPWSQNCMLLERRPAASRAAGQPARRGEDRCGIGGSGRSVAGRWGEMRGTRMPRDSQVELVALSGKAGEPAAKIQKHFEVLGG